MTIAIVDNNEIFRDALSFYLESELGYRIEGVYESCIHFLKQPPHCKEMLLIIDISLPIEPRLETIEYLLKSAYCKISIAISNYSDNHMKYLARDLGFNKFIAKNKVYEELSEVLNNYE